LLPAIRASIAIPGVFPPLLLGDRVLVDGGLVNVVPYDCLAGSCDVVIAVDELRSRLVAIGFAGEPHLPGR
jgi:NTE family protein